MRFAHDDGQGGTSKVSVQLEIDNEKRIIPINTDRILLKREFDTTSGKDTYMIDNKIILKNDVYSLFGLSGIAFNDIWRTIHQGKISEISNLDEDGVLELLFDYSGATHLKERLDSLRGCLELWDEKKESIDKFKVTVEEKLEYIASKVSDFEKLQQLTTEKHSYEYLKLKKAGEELKNDLDDNEEKRKQLLSKLNNAKVDKTNYLQRHDLLITSIKEIEGSLSALKDKRKILKEFIDMNNYSDNKVLIEMQEFKKLQEGYERNLEHINKSIDELSDLLDSTTNAKEDCTKMIEKLTVDFSNVQSEYLNEKEKYDMLNEEINNVSLKKSGFKSEKDRKKYYQEEIEKIVLEITSLERDLGNEIKNKQKHEELLKSLPLKVAELKAELEDRKKEEAKIKSDLDPSKKRKENSDQVYMLNFRLNEQRIERDENLRKMQRIEEIIESADKNFKSIKRLARKLEESDISGYLGLFIDLIEVEERYEFIIDIALRGKMFVFVVETVKDAEKVIRINKEIKGGVISCFPLELIDEVNYRLPDIPSSNEIKPILEYVKVKKTEDNRIQKLLNSFLGKTVLVKNLSAAFGVSERYKDVTSITSNMKIVSPGAYIAKTGYCDMSKKRITPYRQLSKLRLNDEELKKNIFELETSIQNYQTADLKILRDIQEYKLIEKQTVQAVQNLAFEIMEKNSKYVECQQSHEKSSNLIITMTKQVETLKSSRDKLEADKKSGGKVAVNNTEDLSQLMKALEQKKNSVIKSRMMLNNIQKELDSHKHLLHNTLSSRELQLIQLLEEKKMEEGASSKRRSKQRRSNFDIHSMIGYDHQTVKNKEQELERISELIEKLEVKLEEVQKEVFESSSSGAEIDDDIMLTVVDLEKLNVDRRNLHDRIALDRLEELKQKSDPHILDKDIAAGKLDEMIRKKVHEIKEIEKSGNQSHMYGFFLRMKDQFEDVKRRVDKLGDAKHKIYQILDESENSKNVAIQNSLKKLSKKFNEYFKYFVKDAETSIKFIRSTIEVKDEPKEVDVKDEEVIQQSNDSERKALRFGDHQYTGISVRVGFKDKNRMQSMKELSGGEKTVVALSLLFALNSLTSSQIYLLDEIDSALDKTYREGLIDMLSKVSSDSSTQFFIWGIKNKL